MTDPTEPESGAPGLGDRAGESASAGAAKPAGGPPPPTGHARSGKPADEVCRALGQPLVVRLAAAIRVGRAYNVANQVFAQQMETFLQALRPVLDEFGEAVLVALNNDLYLNGARIPVKTGTIRFHHFVLEEFKTREIAGFQALAGLDSREAAAFFHLFMQPESYPGPELLQTCLSERIDHLLPAIHASTEAPTNSGPIDPFASWTNGPGSGSGPGDGPGDGDSSGPVDPNARAGVRGAPRRNYSVAVRGARSLLTTTALQGGVEMRHAKRVVQPLVDGAYASEPIVVGLSTLSNFDEYTYAHSVNVCMVAVTIGHFLRLDRKTLSDLGVAALLHDVGKHAVSDSIHHPLDDFTDEERAACERHAVEGAKLLARSTTLNPTTLRCMRAALEHHMAADGRGYPSPEGWSASTFSQIVSAADCYVSLLMHRSPRGRWVTPHQAVGMMLGPYRSRFHPALLWALVQAVGLYPPGQLVELDDGYWAVVLAPSREDPARPHVRLIRSPMGEEIPPEHATEFRPLPPERRVRRALRGQEYPEQYGGEPKAA